jgi:membrane protein implicated in regulation of membrane protease activity
MHPSFLWLIAGTCLCGLELFVPTALVAMFLGVAAFIMAALATILPAWLGLQVAIWLCFTGILAWMGYRFMPKRSPLDFNHTEAKALTEILPDRSGRVLYEGVSWRARCGDGVSSIEPEQQLHVIGREGTTLIVVPLYTLEM